MESLMPLTATGQPLSLHDVGVSDAPLIVYIDFKSPYAFLAIEPTRQMLKKLGLLADWRPFVLDIGSYLGTAKLANDGKVASQSRSKEQWSGVKYAYFDCRRYANLADLTIREWSNPPNWRNAGSQSKRISHPTTALCCGTAMPLCHRLPTLRYPNNCRYPAQTVANLRANPIFSASAALARWPERHRDF